MKLYELMKKLDYEVIVGEDVETTTLVYDSRKVESGSVFVCIVGANSDGHTYIYDVINKGVAAVVVQNDVDIDKCREINKDITIVKVDNTRYALALMSAEYFGNPAEKLTVVGITGTKGKTTTTYLVKNVLEAAGHKVGLVGTIEIIIGDKVISAVNTTPESYILQEYFATMVEAGLDTVVMEVSSQGLMLHRTAGIMFDYGIFSNLSPDHIGPNEHKDFDDYKRCKGLLFKQCKLGLINIDDEHALDVIKEHTCEIVTFGFSDKADIKAENVSLCREGSALGIEYDVKGLMDMHVKVGIPGKFSVYNSLTAIALTKYFNVPQDKIIASLENAHVKGRVEIVPIGDRPFTVMIDYAHNHMSMKSLFETMKEYNPKRLVVVFGAGGNRAKSRRYDMGEVAAQYADFSIITTDNPRNEEPQDIIKDIMTGFEKGGSGEHIIIEDRREAIEYSIKNALEGDVIMIVGKGHENYQEIKGVKYHFDDREVVEEYIAKLG